MSIASLRERDASRVALGIGEGNRTTGALALLLLFGSNTKQRAESITSEWVLLPGSVQRLHLQSTADDPLAVSYTHLTLPTTPYV